MRFDFHLSTATGNMFAFPVDNATDFSVGPPELINCPNCSLSSAFGHLKPLSVIESGLRLMFNNASRTLNKYHYFPETDISEHVVTFGTKLIA